MRSVIYARSEHGRALHPTQKPEDLVELLLRYSCPPHGIVLDPFGGAGTTAVVAKALNRHCILIELNPAYVAIARKRLQL
jgi:site-specific DNA-methyltransferase (adenine-specific)